MLHLLFEYFLFSPENHDSKNGHSSNDETIIVDRLQEEVFRQKQWHWPALDVVEETEERKILICDFLVSSLIGGALIKVDLAIVIRILRH